MKIKLLAQLTMFLCFWVLGTNPCYAQAKDPRAPERQSKQAPVVPADQLGEINGSVSRADTGQPLNKAIVTLIPSSDPMQGISVRTDSGGRFQFIEVLPGTYNLRAQRNGFVSQTYGQRAAGPGISLTVNAGQHVNKVDFRLVPAGVVTGTILDEDSEPVEDLLVHALRMRFNRGGRLAAAIARTARTDDAGTYRLPGLSPGFYYIQAGGRGDTVSINLQAPPVGYGTMFYPNTPSREEASRVQVPPGAVIRGIDITVHSSETFTISGTIADSKTSSASKRYSVGFAFPGGGTATADTNQKDGSFAFHGIAPGEYLLVASVTEDGGPTRRGYNIVKVVDSDVRILIEIGHAGEVGGEARIEDGQPFSFDGLRVALIAENPGGISVGAAIQDKGEFRVRNVPAGDYSFQLSGREDQVYLKTVRCGGEDYSTKPIQVNTTEKVGDCVLTLSRGVSSVSGKVSQRDKPADGLVVVLIPVEMERRRNPRNTMIAQSDPNGLFQIRGVIPGDYFVFAVAPSDDTIFYDLEFANRNRESAERITVKLEETGLVNLKPTIPR